MSVRPLNNYPGSIGAVNLSVVPHAGPTSYTQVTITPGAAISGGDSFLATEAGLKNLDAVQDSVTDDGAFVVIAIPNAPSTPQNGASPKTYTLMWIANKTALMGGQNQTFGTEAVAATNLSAFTVRLTAIGI